MSRGYWSGSYYPKFKPKDESMDKHVIKRMKQRYGLDITTKDIKTIVKQIERQDNCEFLFKESLTKSFWRVNFNGCNIIAVYYPHKRKLRTVLTEEMLDEWTIEEDDYLLLEKGNY